MMPTKQGRSVRWQDLFRRVREDQAGSISVEFALVSVVLIILAAGAFDFGSLAMERSRIATAAHAGSQFAMQMRSAALSVDDVIAVVRNEAGDSTNELDVEPRQFCQCNGGAAIACGDTCPDGNFAPLHLELRVSGVYELVFPFSFIHFIDDSYDLSETRTVRIR